MQYLLTNDDGIDAPGLAALEQALYLTVGESAAAITAAPAEGYSGCGHLVNNHRPIRIETLTNRRYRVQGAPADCTRIGLSQLTGDIQWVLSGINLGANVGVDIWMSGTVSAVREAGWSGVPGIAISQYFKQELPINWTETTKATVRVLREIFDRPVGRSFWNVNLPAVETPAEQLDMVYTFVEPKHLPISYQEQPSGVFRYTGDYRSRPRTPGSDVDACFGGAISITEIPWPGIP